MLVFVVLFPVVVDYCGAHAVPAHDGRVFFLSRVSRVRPHTDCGLTENSSNTNGPFSAIVRSLVDLNLSDGSANICFFFELTVALGFDLSLEKPSETPTGNCSAGRRQARASTFDNVVLY